MVRRLVVLGAAVAGVTTTSAARAAPAAGPDTIVVYGEVTAATSRWTADGSRIVTDALVRAPDGRVTAVSQLGGHVGELTMRTMPGPPVLAPGMSVQLLARQARTGDGRAMLSVDEVEVVRDAREGFVRTGPTPGGHYLRWASGCVQLGIAEEGTRAIAGDNEVTVFEDVIATWNQGVAACSYMDVVSIGQLHDREVGTDRVNVLKFRDVTWCRPALKDDPPRCYSQTTAGITTVVYVDDPGNTRDGEIVDADIELNGVDFAISVNGITLDDSGCQAELANTLTHEMGHMLGLEHTCRVDSDPPRVDDQGADVPLCSATSDPAIVDATMYNYQDCGETKKESLSADEIDALCAVYPIAEDPHQCNPPGDGAGCCDAGADGTGALALSLLVALAIRRRRI